VWTVVLARYQLTLAEEEHDRIVGDGEVAEVRRQQLELSARGVRAGRWKSVRPAAWLRAATGVSKVTGARLVRSNVKVLKDVPGWPWVHGAGVVVDGQHQALRRGLRRPVRLRADRRRCTAGCARRAQPRQPSRPNSWRSAATKSETAAGVGVVERIGDVDPVGPSFAVVVVDVVRGSRTAPHCDRDDDRADERRQPVCGSPMSCRSDAPATRRCPSRYGWWWASVVSGGVTSSSR
jgi:hypothetical protein